MIEITSEYLASHGRSATFPFRFWSRVAIGDGCWEYMRYRDPNGYGRIGRGKHGTGGILTHHASWILSCGPIPHGLFILHRCDNPPCVRPDHLFIGNQADNVRDMISKGRAVHDNPPRGEDNVSHILTEENVFEIRCSDRHRGYRLEFARRFGVSTSTIKAVVRRVNWRHI